MIDIDKEKKKLNYALDSYPCTYAFDYEYDYKDGSMALILKDVVSKETIRKHKVALPVTEEELTAFKKEAISLCTHATEKKGS